MDAELDWFFGRGVKSIRADYGIEQKELADLLGITLDELVQIELGKRELSAPELIVILEEMRRRPRLVIE